jgi:hypothetical protein
VKQMIQIHIHERHITRKVTPMRNALAVPALRLITAVRVLHFSRAVMVDYTQARRSTRALQYFWRRAWTREKGVEEGGDV